MLNDTVVDAASQEKFKLIGLPTLMTLAFNGGDLAAIGEQLLARIKSDSHDANALMDMAVLFIMRGETKLARSMQTLAIQTKQVFHFPRPALPVKIRALAILGPGDLMANSPFEFLIEDQPIALDMLYITPSLSLPEIIPEHDVLIVAIGESDRNQPLLSYLDTTLNQWPRPVINQPCRISQLSRDAACAQLMNSTDIVMPPAMRITRDALEQCCRPEEFACTLTSQLNGVDYPIIIRPIDSHAGLGLNKIESLSALTGYLVDAPENIFFVSPFIDYRSADGLFRKYRLILINGVAYACHMAISSRWMVHYLNADMLENAGHRAEEAQFMENFNTDFAVRHASAIQAIYTQLGLDYVGIDCAETPDGKLLIFEVDSNMVVHNMDSAEKFPYKKIQMPKLFNAFAQLLAQRCGIIL
ncbi:ATP-grasp domain-containing protein [Solimicrobium silvestre]|uniref:RimK-like ATP-grasp domain n=1 Tax=Solimicrobium silvestre TaxID=2099400 RepID=A0A2S9GUV5_9BURK|nr:RimK family alpha-L-glutamate ligase [Solimicrobium silvestre]PRC91499.1 RimK-like ATP-grasp domain [Solimicrobium silvestre]